MRSRGLTHVAMSVPPGTLSDAWRADVVEFYGARLGWREIDELRLPDRLTLAVGRGTYVNIRERDEPMHAFGYEHIGVLVDSATAADELWNELNAESRDVNLEPLHKTGDDGYRSFRFRYQLPFAIEIQHFPPSG
jgi:hypothetical protein